MANETTPTATDPAATLEESNRGYAAYVAEQLADAQRIPQQTVTSVRSSGNARSKVIGGRIASGRFKGMTEGEARQILMQEYAGFDDAAKLQYDQRGAGENLKPSSMLPPGFQPPATGSTMTDMRGRSVTLGPSASAPARQKAMDEAAAARRAGGRQAVAAAKAAQAADPMGIAQRVQAANDARLAESGVTDMGGGFKALDNQYGTGFAKPMTPQEAADRKAGKTRGVIADEKGLVDVGAMMKNAGTGTTVPYQEKQPDEFQASKNVVDHRANIQAGIAAAAPGMAERRAADAQAIAGKIAAAVPPPPGAAAKPAPLPDDRPRVAAAAASGSMLQRTAANTNLADLPGKASAAASGSMIPRMRATGVANTAMATLPPAFQPKPTKPQAPTVPLRL